jgi:very-short-patch-repair endonuclease/predicted transcriptional regulator of viral defense system
MDPQTHADRTIAELAARQWGVASRRQLLDAGLSATVVRGRVRSGHLLRLHRGVYAVGHARLRREGWWLAAVLAVGPAAVLSHRDAAGLHDLRPANHTRTDVTTTRQPRAIDGIAVHRTTVLDADDITTISGVPVTTVARTLLDLAGIVPHDHLTNAIKEAERQRTFDLRAIEAVMARMRGRTGRGHSALRQAIEEYANLGLSATDSLLEDAFHRLVRDNGLPSPAINAYVEGFKIDAVWRSHRVAVELDGWAHHHSRRAFERDRERDATLTENGWRVVRFTYRQLRERPDRVVHVLRRLGIA